ncbi:uncharacterized protein LOC121413858 [Lytechinus variegatus]|uniref:uncharacterized protein LOC121413858 n=1 Tax=Lytechinus variegatus TaxID=7654 RepID=UPI001BB15207|nr:uncharacterized protein LOC121413858 [Lytechinus variegatus]
MTLSHALHDGIISSLNLWKVVGNKPFSKPGDCKMTNLEYEAKITKPIRKRMKEIIKDLRLQIALVDEVLQRADAALEGKTFPKKFAATNDYFKEFREVASNCSPSKVLADFARVVSATQMLINKSSFLSDRLSALGPDIPLTVKQPFLRTSADGITYKGYTMEKQFTGITKELIRYRKAMLYVSDEIKTLDGKLKKQAMKDKKIALKMKLGKKKCPKSNRTAAQLNMAKVPSSRVISIMPSIEEVEEAE